MQRSSSVSPSIVGCGILGEGGENLYVSIETTVTSIQAQNIVSWFRLVQQSFSGTPLLLFDNNEAILLRFFSDTLSARHSGTSASWMGKGNLIREGF